MRGWLRIAVVVLALTIASASAHGARLFYIGLALWPEPWSENDVVDLATRLQQTSKYEVVRFVASNVGRRSARYPIADDKTISEFVKSAAEQAGPDDVVFVAISTHGAPKVLARKVGDSEPIVLSSRGLARMLAPLARLPSVVVISACYSGSLIADLRTPRRIIITAARADRSSFGCEPDSRHTFFGQAELDGFGQPDRSLSDVLDVIRQDVSRMERDQQVTASEPQVWVGAEAMELFHAPLF